MAMIKDELVTKDFGVPDYQSMPADKTVIRCIVAEQNAKSGFVPNPNAAAYTAQAMMLADGVKPEDCIGSRGIIEAREEKY